MGIWSRVNPDDYRKLPLRAHTLLAEVPLHDVWRVELPGGGPGRTIQDVRSLFLTVVRGGRLNPIVRALFGLRTALGRVLRWDRPMASFEEHSFRHQLTEQDRRQSLIDPGTPDGPFAVLYVHDKEAASEVRNATVHAFSVLALERTTSGYQLYWAIYVRPVGRGTGLYMALIDPFRRLFVYPAILRRIHQSWLASYKA